MGNYYRGVEQLPYHLSVGAVPRNEQGEIACHHFREIFGLQDIYILMRETMEPGETPEAALHRGLMEEFGATATIDTYLGSLTTRLATDPSIQKTTLYFLCNLNSIDLSLRMPGDLETESEVEWHAPNFLIEKMKAQGVQDPEGSLDESDVLGRIVGSVTMG
jgi:hypothetical protein